jgi:hypothetical protein
VELTMTGNETATKVWVDVDDGIVIKSVHNKDMRITSAFFVYVAEGDRWVPKAVHVTGYRLKQDGSVGRKADDRLYADPEYFPKWVAEAAEHYRPKAASPLDPIPTCVLDTGSEQ